MTIFNFENKPVKVLHYKYDLSKMDANLMCGENRNVLHRIDNIIPSTGKPSSTFSIYGVYCPPSRNDYICCNGFMNFYAKDGKTLTKRLTSLGIGVDNERFFTENYGLNSIAPKTRTIFDKKTDELLTHVEYNKTTNRPKKVYTFNGKILVSRQNNPEYFKDILTKENSGDMHSIGFIQDHANILHPRLTKSGYIFNHGNVYKSGKNLNIELLDKSTLNLRYKIQLDENTVHISEFHPKNSSGRTQTTCLINGADDVISNFEGKTTRQILLEAREKLQELTPEMYKDKNIDFSLLDKWIEKFPAN